MTIPEANGNVAPEAAAASKPKRVRTGCLTCRERHLKCDEGLPHCQNCRKSNRTCKRGLRLNFIDTQVQSPPYVPTSSEWRVQFLDESRDIASEYRGGLARYSGPEQEVTMEGNIAQQAMQTHVDPNLQQYDYPPAAPQAPSMAYQGLPPIHGMLPDNNYQEAPSSNNLKYETPQHFHGSTHSTNDSPFSQGHANMHGSTASFVPSEQEVDSCEEKREFLNSQEEVLFMQVFVEEVGLWMDSMDSTKHEPMLLNAFLACGARHLTLINSVYTDEKALYYYDTATRYLLKNLQNPNRDTVICATTAVILNVYEIMSERALQRMNHIAGARALIKECGWNAQASGIGAACFWLNVGLEVLSCLHFNWQVAWDPDDWGVDMDFTREKHNGREEIWTHRMLYIVAKVCNFRATVPKIHDARLHEADPREEEMQRQNRFNEWTRLKNWIDAWNDNIPRTMHPMAYLYPYQTTSKSCFPEVWLVKRSTIVARLFYHTVMVLMAQIHPYLTLEAPEMHELQTRHSQMICGISAHVKDRGVASVALRSLAHAAECLTDRREQAEVLEIFAKINRETGWRISFVYKELKEKWGWPDDAPPPSLHAQQPIVSNFASTAANTLLQGGTTGLQYGQPHYQTMPTVYPAVSAPTPAPAQPAYRRPQSGIVNPMFATADFSMPTHPYQNVWVAPNTMAHQAPALYY